MFCFPFIAYEYLYDVMVQMWLKSGKKDAKMCIIFHLHAVDHIKEVVMVFYENPVFLVF